MTCPGPHTVAAVQVEMIQTDRKVVITRSCGHAYIWGGILGEPVPVLGSPAMACLGPQLGGFEREGDALPAVFDPRKRPTKRRNVA